MRNIHHIFCKALLLLALYAINNGCIYANATETPYYNHMETPDSVNTLSKSEISDSLTHVKNKKLSNPIDSATKILPETVVEAQTSFHTPRSSVYIPLKKQKNTAFNAMELLARMNIPQLVSTPSGKFTAANGSDISYFINGKPASTEELSGMNISDIRKVEYLDFPEEPDFLGAQHAINFITQVYEYGGYTRAALDHWYNKGFMLTESIFSKWSYKDMTYDLSFAPNNTKALNDHKETIETFNFENGEIKRVDTPDKSKTEYASYPLKLRALYSRGSTYISNSLGYHFYDKPISELTGNIRYTGYDSDNVNYQRENPSHSSSFTWEGFASFRPGNWALSLSGNLFYTHYNKKYCYNSFFNDNSEKIILSDIYNFIKENSLDGKLQAEAYKRLSPVHSINLMASASYRGSRMKYIDKDGMQGKFSLPGFYIRAGYNLNLEKFRLTTNLGIGYEESKMDSYKVRTTYPFGTLSLDYVINPVNNFSLWMQYSTFSPLISSKNPILIQRDELTYVEGNPDIKPYPRFELSFNYMFRPSTHFQIFSMFNWNFCHDRYHTIYSRMPGKTAILQSFENSGNTNSVSLRINFALRLFGNNLVITSTPEYRIQHTSSPGLPTLHPFDVYSTITGYLGNFYIRATHLSGNTRKYSDQQMDYISIIPHDYGLSAGWGNGKVRAELTVKNMFRTKCDERKSIILSPIYSSYGTFRFPYDKTSFRITLSYTFSYGKKINSYDEIGAGVSSSSSAVNL